MTLVLELADFQEAALNAKARALGMSAEEYAQQVLNRDLVEDAEQSISSIFRDIWGDVPDDIRAKRPSDGAEQIDHYVYGVPKRRQ